MRTILAILVLSGCCSFCGCKREVSIPGDSFRLTVENVNPHPDTDFRVSLLTIHVSHAASISIDGPNGAHRGQKLSDAPDGVVREGKVSLSAARVVPSQKRFAYIQTLINPYAEHHVPRARNN